MNCRPATLWQPAQDITKGTAGCTWKEMEERQISNQTHYYNPLRLGNSWEVSSDLGGLVASKDLQVNGQVGLGVLANGGDQSARLNQHLVGIVVE